MWGARRKSRTRCKRGFKTRFAVSGDEPDKRFPIQKTLKYFNISILYSWKLAHRSSGRRPANNASAFDKHTCPAVLCTHCASCNLRDLLEWDSECIQPAYLERMQKPVPLQDWHLDRPTDGKQVLQTAWSVFEVCCNCNGIYPPGYIVSSQFGNIA